MIAGKKWKAENVGNGDERIKKNIIFIAQPIDREPGSKWRKAISQTKKPPLQTAREG